MVNNQKDQHGPSKQPLSEPFPVGMRVLAVDDDRVCLRTLEQMLIKCRYNVTATTQSRKAIEMLRENKDKFDLIISDVNMPDIDGFKLLELVGLEMDLPVIMVTEHKEPNLVKKGVVHGACDYLLKPVRMEELQIIWRHVFRRKVDHKDHKACNVAGQGIQGVVIENCANHDNKRLDKRRREQSEEEEEDADDYEQENENTSTHKKPRLVWDDELRRKFQAAVNQLGLDKAVPKKILMLMNVEGVTRENVASHLQKYRMNLRRAAQQGRTVAASDPYLHMPLLDPYASGSGRLPTTGITSYASGGIYSRLHSSHALNLRGMSSSVLFRPDNSQNMIDSIKGLGNIQPNFFSTNQSSNFMQGIPAANEPYHFQQNNYWTGIRPLNPADISSDNALSGFTSNNSLLQGNYPATHHLNSLRNQSPLEAAYVRAGSFDQNEATFSVNHDQNSKVECDFDPLGIIFDADYTIGSCI
ncbi:hypothetical protein PIB30_013931 [Stylosanthes scabra]|uniref:Two-component response regulator n=1 Tax=Stylosanthes scabra TaxID=79078 RepID=A0ABU6W9Q2_9FABA|nr:hypothetical protein [Stylosanthes scabra]